MPTWGPLFSMMRMELVELKDRHEDNVSKGLIHQSSLLVAAAARFTEKPDGGLQYCNDYPNIISKTIENEYPLSYS